MSPILFLIEAKNFFVKKNLLILSSPPLPPEENMAKDASLLADLGPSPLLHFYAWDRPSATYGYFIQIGDWIQEAQQEVSFARRPTGGGIIFHLFDYAFSFLLPSAHPSFSDDPIKNYAFVNGLVLEAIAPLYPPSLALTPATALTDSPFCTAKPTIYDLLVHGQKVAGSAQRKKRQGYLHQGTISLAPPDLSLLLRVIKDKKTAETIYNQSLAILPPNWTPQELADLREEVKNLLILQFTRQLSK